VGRIPVEWDVKKVAEICEISRGRVISKKTMEVSDDIYPVYSSQTLNNGCMGYIDTYDYEGEYVTWTTDGVNAGKTFYRNEKFNATNICGLLKVKLDFVDAAFVAYTLDTFTDKYVVRNGNPKLMSNIMAIIPIPISLDIDEQRKISKNIQSFDTVINQYQDQKTDYIQLKDGLIQQLLTDKEIVTI